MNSAPTWIVLPVQVLKPEPTLHSHSWMCTTLHPAHQTAAHGPLQLADPEDACGPFTFKDHATPWVALISRNQPPLDAMPTLNCTFDIKVRIRRGALQ